MHATLAVCNEVRPSEDSGQIDFKNKCPVCRHQFPHGADEYHCEGNILLGRSFFMERTSTPQQQETFKATAITAFEKAIAIRKREKRKGRDMLDVLESQYPLYETYAQLALLHTPTTDRAGNPAAAAMALKKAIAEVGDAFLVGNQRDPRLKGDDTAQIADQLVEYGTCLRRMAKGSPCAVNAFKFALRLNGDTCERHFFLGQALNEQGDTAGAVKALTAATNTRLTICVKDAVHLRDELGPMLVALSEEDKRKDMPIDCFRRQRLFKLAAYESLIGIKFENAEINAERMANIDVETDCHPDGEKFAFHAPYYRAYQSFAYLLLGKFMQEQAMKKGHGYDKWAATRKCWMRATEVDPVCTDAYYHLGMHERDHGHHEKALFWLKRALLAIWQSEKAGSTGKTSKGEAYGATLCQDIAIQMRVNMEQQRWVSSALSNVEYISERKADLHRALCLVLEELGGDQNLVAAHRHRQKAELLYPPHHPLSPGRYR
jgi:tetratricopeptide (TPR) repeat protein